MRIPTPFLKVLLSSVILARAVLAGKPAPGYITLINATPYNWNLTASHSYQLEWNFPGVILAGTVHEQYIKFKKDHHDDGAEAYYSLVNSPSLASFVVKARAPKHIEIEFQDTLSSLNNPKYSIINLGFVKRGAVLFVLSGHAGSYISSNPPIAWMQSTLSTIGSKSLREIALPASHNSGMNEISFSWGGNLHNAACQTSNVFQQLVNGARLFDIRPTYFHGKFYAGHFSKFGSGMVGAAGHKLTDMVKEINDFTNQYPGELIILEISHQMDADKKFRDLSPKRWAKLFEELNRIQALWVPSSSNVPDDLSSLPISAFITPGSMSAVLIRLPNSAPLPESGNRRRSAMGRDIAAVARIGSAVITDHTDGMTALGPALLGDDDNSTSSEDSASKSDPTTVQPASFTNDDDDGPNPDDSTSEGSSGTPDNNGSGPTPTNLPAEVTIFPIPTGFSAGPTPEPIPAEVTVPAGSSCMAFFHQYRLPITGSYTNTDKPNQLTNDQLATLARERPNPQSEPLKTIWTITQKNFVHITDAGNIKTSIIGLAVAAHRTLFSKLWPAMSSNTYPNMIEVDDIRNNQVTALAMAINDHFASQRISSRSAGNSCEEEKQVA